MKKIFYVLAGVICFSFASCENEDPTSFSSASDLAGIWMVSGNYETSIEASGDVLTVRQNHSGYIDKDNNFVYTGYKSWDELITHTVKYEFNKKDQSIYISGIKAGTFTRLGKDRASFKRAMSFWLYDCELQRVKSVKNVDDVDTNTNLDVPENSVAAEGALPGRFSVSESTTVQFSQGNLQYKASTNTWRFAVQQYYYVSWKNKNISESYDGWIDLFGWGTGNNPTLSSTNSGNYKTFTDWGVNAISNGGNTVNQWRTLTKDEWVYLFYTRTNAATLFGLGSVNDVNGTILLPDNWTTPQGASFTPSTSQGLADQGTYYSNSNINNFSHNTYTAEQWKTMEEAGAVFLPAAGERRNTDVSSVGSGGCYWSSTPGGESHAYIVFFDSGNLSPQGYRYIRYLGLSVRLVQDVK